MKRVRTNTPIVELNDDDSTRGSPAKQSTRSGPGTVVTLTRTVVETEPNDSSPPAPSQEELRETVARLEREYQAERGLSGRRKVRIQFLENQIDTNEGILEAGEQKRQIDELQKAVETLTRQLEAEKLRASEERARAEESLADLSRELEDAKKKGEMAEKTVRDKDEEIACLQLKIGYFNKKNQAFDESIQMKDRMVVTLNEQLRERATEHALMVKEAEQLKKELEKSRKKYDGLARELASTQGSVARELAGLQQRAATMDDLYLADGDEDSNDEEGDPPSRDVMNVRKLEKAFQGAYCIASDAQARVLSLEKRIGKNPPVATSDVEKEKKNEVLIERANSLKKHFVETMVNTANAHQRLADIAQEFVQFEA